jgi:hypothetical protein
LLLVLLLLSSLAHVLSGDFGGMLRKSACRWDLTQV